MANIVSTTTPQKNTVKAVQLKALEQRQKDAALALAKATQFQQVESPWQGAANMLNSFFTARRGSQLAAQEDAARNEVARIRAGFGPEGGNMQQLQELAKYDEETANQLMRDLQSRTFQTKEREAGQTFETLKQEDVQAQQTSERIAGQEFTKGQNESEQDFELRKQAARNEFEAAQNEATRGVTKRGQDLDVQTTTAGQDVTKRGQDISAGTAADRLKLDTEKQTFEQNQPPAITSVPQAVDAYNAGKYGPVGSDEAKMLRDAEIRKLTHVNEGGSSKTITVMTENGPVTIEESSGGKGGGGGAGGAGNKPPSIGQYQTEAKSASDMLANIANVEKALKNPGYTGPGGKAIGMGADLVDAAAGIFGTPEQQQAWRDMAGDPASRKVVSADSVQTILNNVRGLPGAISNKETGLLAQLGTSLENNPEANAIMLGVARRMAENAQLRGQMASEYFAKNGTLDGFEDRVWAPYIDSHPVLQYNEQTKAIEMAGAASPEPPVSTAPAPVTPPGGTGRVFKFDPQGNPLP